MFASLEGRMEEREVVVGTAGRAVYNGEGVSDAGCDRESTEYGTTPHSRYKQGQGLQADPFPVE
jgi:hypothetical protein